MKRTYYQEGVLSAPGTHYGDHGADLHVVKQPFGVSNTHADASMGRRRDTEWGWKRNFASLRDFVWDAMKANVSALATLGESGHPPHAFVRVWCVKSLS